MTLPVSITAPSGTVFHVFQYPDNFRLEPVESIKFNTLSNDLSDGYHSQVLFGSNTGLRTFSLRLPTLAALEVLPNTLTGIHGETMSREQYIWDLYCDTMITGTPFVYPSGRNGQYYLVRFVDEELSYARAQIKLYSSGIKLQQVRVSGETVFDISPVVPTTSTSQSILVWLKGPDFATPNWAAGTDYEGVQRGSANMAATGNVASDLTGTNGIDTVQFSLGATNTGLVSGSVSTGQTVGEIFIVMKMREATFSNVAGIVTGTGGGGPTILTGESGTTKFTNPGLSASAYKYELNGVEYAQSNQQAPMNAWGIVHLRYTTGWATLADTLQFGKNKTTAGTFAEMDVGEIIVFHGVIPTVMAREVTEYLAVKWGVTL